MENLEKSASGGDPEPRSAQGKPTSGAVKKRETGSIFPWKCGLRQGQGPEV